MKYEIRARALAPEELPLVSVWAIERLFNSLLPEVEVDVGTLGLRVLLDDFGGYVVYAEVEAI